MPKYENILFDLDGTITDSAIGIINGVIYGIKKINEIHNLNIEIPSKDILRKFIGPPLDISFMKYCHKDENLANEFIKYYRKDYNENDGLFNCKLYDGIFDLIKNLHDKKFNLFVATAKPKESAVRIIEHFNLNIFFKEIYAPVFGEKSKNKTDVLIKALSKEKFDKSKTIMIGDRIDDIDGAKNVGIDSIAVRYGFGEDKEFENATYIVDDAKSVFDILIK
ncbi:HAD-IA family hydrolase [Brachyspira catarrhinii]|uniref:HAD family hydrolase n=1 Tax=Brachyspira catarrhinii TaxID=2528966 RepID=A0ABY2TT85_9SPIR|nr:HAD-IA family hydrolase [Brachyspira catarrhinii]TKZ36089.1 HAD family hydrolase [Brachyspira catarrhinii]